MAKMFLMACLFCFLFGLVVKVYTIYNTITHGILCPTRLVPMSQDGLSLKIQTIRWLGKQLVMHYNYVTLSMKAGHKHY